MKEDGKSSGNAEIGFQDLRHQAFGDQDGGGRGRTRTCTARMPPYVYELNKLDELLHLA